ncbi:MAG: IS3 family transposase [Bacteroidota bacterium]
MKRSRFSETQVVKILKQHEAGISVKELCKEHGISAATFYNWKGKYGGMDASQLKKLKEMESELSRYKQMYAELAHQNYALKDLIEKKPLGPTGKRCSADYLVEEHRLSLRTACMLLCLSTSVYYYRPKARDDGELIAELDRLAQEHPTYGFRKMFLMLRHQGHPWNHKRVYRVYKEMKLNVRRKRKRRIPQRVKEPLTLPIGPNIVWSMDFMHDSLSYGKSFRVLNIIDDFNREALWSAADVSIGSQRLVRELDRLVAFRGKPQMIRVDNGPEFTSANFQLWCRAKNIEIKYIQPGKPVQNSLIERFNRSYRQEVLNAYLFESLSQVRTLTEQWVEHYNEKRPHEALQKMTPREFLNKYGKASFSISNNDVICKT